MVPQQECSRWHSGGIEGQSACTCHGLWAPAEGHIRNPTCGCKEMVSCISLCSAAERPGTALLPAYLGVTQVQTTLLIHGFPRPQFLYKFSLSFSLGRTSPYCCGLDPCPVLCLQHPDFCLRDSEIESGFPLLPMSLGGAMATAHNPKSWSNWKSHLPPPVNF